MPHVPLRPDASETLCQNYPKKEVVNAIVGIARYGARIGFQGDRNGQYISKNLTTADELPEILEQDVAEQESHDRLTK